MKASISVHRTKMVPDRSGGIYYKSTIKYIPPLVMLGRDDKFNFCRVLWGSMLEKSTHVLCVSQLNIDIDIRPCHKIEYHTTHDIYITSLPEKTE